MLDVALEREVEGDLCLHDLGHGLPLRPGCFDGAISISAVQWLCNAVRHSGVLNPLVNVTSRCGCFHVLSRLRQVVGAFTEQDQVASTL